MRLEAYDVQDALSLTLDNIEKMFYITTNTWRDLVYAMNLAFDFSKVTKETDIDRFVKLLEEENEELLKEYNELTASKDEEGTLASLNPRKYGEHRKVETIIPLMNKLDEYLKELDKYGVPYRVITRPDIKSENINIDWDHILEVVNKEENYYSLNSKIKLNDGTWGTYADWTKVEGLTELEKRQAKCFLVHDKNEKCFKLSPSHCCFAFRFDDLGKATNLINRVDIITRTLNEYKAMGRKRGEKQAAIRSERVLEKNKDKGISR